MRPLRGEAKRVPAKDRILKNRYTQPQIALAAGVPFIGPAVPDEDAVPSGWLLRVEKDGIDRLSAVYSTAAT